MGASFIRLLTPASKPRPSRSEEHTSELQSLRHLVCRLLLEKTINTFYGTELETEVYIISQVIEKSYFEEMICGEPEICGMRWMSPLVPFDVIFFFNAAATTEIYTLSLHDALPI